MRGFWNAASSADSLRGAVGNPHFSFDDEDPLGLDPSDGSPPSSSSLDLASSSTPRAEEHKASSTMPSSSDDLGKSAASRGWRYLC